MFWHLFGIFVIVFLMNVFASFCICFAFFRIFGNVVGLESVSPRGYVGCSKLYIICLAAPSALDWGDKVCRWFVVGRNVTAWFCMKLHVPVGNGMFSIMFRHFIRLPGVQKQLGWVPLWSVTNGVWIRRRWSDKVAICEEKHVGVHVFFFKWVAPVYKLNH
jgi:hypothetical protein